MLCDCINSVEQGKIRSTQHAENLHRHLIFFYSAGSSNASRAGGICAFQHSCLTWRCLINPMHINKKERAWSTGSSCCWCCLFMAKVLIQMWSVYTYMNIISSWLSKVQPLLFMIQQCWHCSGEGRGLRRAGSPKGTVPGWHRRDQHTWFPLCCAGHHEIQWCQGLLCAVELGVSPLTAGGSPVIELPKQRSQNKSMTELKQHQLSHEMPVWGIIN